MKKLLVSLLLAALLFSLVSCSISFNPQKTDNSEIATESQTEKSEEPKYSLGDTVSTDIIDFTLKKAQFSYYASSFSLEYAEPLDEDSGGIFSTSTGRCFVCMTFSMKNTGRGEINVCGSGSDAWKLKFKVHYKGKKYEVKGFDLNNNDGYPFGFDLGFSAISTDEGRTFEVNNSANLFLYSGKPLVVRIPGVIKLEPDNLNDPFDLEVYVLNSDGKTESFIYEIK